MLISFTVPSSFLSAGKGSYDSPQVSTMKPSSPTPARARRGTLNSQLSIPIVDVSSQSNEFADAVFSDISYGNDTRDHEPIAEQPETYQNPSFLASRHPQMVPIPSSETSTSTDQLSLNPLSLLKLTPSPVKSTNSLFSAIREHAPLLHHSDDGEVEYGTLTGLINRLFKNSQGECIGFIHHRHSAETSYLDAERDKEYRKTFLTTYLAFTTAEDILRIFSYRLHTAEPNTSRDGYLERSVTIIQ